MAKVSNRTVTAGHIQIQYLEAGAGDGVPVFLLHGFPDSPATWARVVERLSDKKLRLILPYVRGTGESKVLAKDHMSGQLAALASDVLTLADLLGIRRFHLVGQDWGARTAYAVAALAPERVVGMVAMASPYVSFGGETEPPEQAHAYWYQWYFNTEHGAKAFAEDVDGFSAALWKAWSPTWRFNAKEFAEAALAFRNPQFVGTVLHSYRQRWKGAPGAESYAVDEVVLEARPKIAVPTVYAFGTEDACVLPASSKAQAPWFTGLYRRLAVKGAGHFIQREEPGIVARLIEQMLKDTASR